MKTFVFGILILLVCATSISKASERSTTPDVALATKNFLQAFENLDWETFRKMFDDDATVFFPSPEPPQRFERRVAYEAQFQKVFEAIRQNASGGPPYHKLVPIEMQISELSTGVALVTFHLRNEIRIARRTIVFTKNG